MSAVCLVAHAGLLWVFIEATTLASAPLIYIHKNPRSLEATWKYLLICSVGIALALFGNLLLSISIPPEGEGTTLSLLFSDLITLAPKMEIKLLKGAFIFLVVGYGTKMGLAPMHTWLPDAHSEAPGFVSSLLSGALLNCAFLGILRFYSVLLTAGEAQADFAAGVLKGFGLLSMGLAAVFLCNQKDYKRLLAYSSIEHMGILAFAMGIGGLGAFGALYHGVNHSLVKASLFLSAGMILKAYKTKEVAGVKGMARRIPGTALLWGAGFFAATGFPPFGTFFSEFYILREAFSGGKVIGGIFFLLFLTLAFFGIAATVLPMIQGKGESSPREEKETFPSLLVPAFFLLLCLTLGLWLPEPLADHFTMAASLFGGLK
ncbi:MAG: hypothetical protein JW760_08490, partial [Spirochaetales bacterium]|nr:hypothetical protein [Spirochaetales bacterium]